MKSWSIFFFIESNGISVTEIEITCDTASVTTYQDDARDSSVQQFEKEAEGGGGGGKVSRCYCCSQRSQSMRPHQMPMNRATAGQMLLMSPGCPEAGQGRNVWE